MHTLEVALRSVYNSVDFENALILAVNLANDSDTVGAFAGQIVGAMYGVDEIPHHWLPTCKLTLN